MAHTISITDGSTTIALTSSGVIVTDFPLQSPDSRQSEVLLGTDGAEISRPQWTNPTEGIEVLLTGTSAAVRAKGNAIEQMLNKARDSRRLMTNQRVYLQVQIDGEADTYRSEILSARFVWQNPLNEIPRGKAQASIIITRRYYWEGPEAQILLSSAATSPQTTSPVTLHNDSDFSTNNYFQIGSGESSKAGQLPSPMRIKLINNEAGGIGIRNIYLSNFTFVGTVSPFRRGAQNVFAHGAVFTGVNSNNNHAYSWVIPDATLAAYGGRYARILVGFNTNFDGYMQAGERHNSIIDMYRNEQVRGGGDFSRLIDLGAMPIPPGRDLPNPTEVSIDLWVQKAGGITVDLRYIQMTPAGEGIFRRLYNSSQVAAGDAIIDDGINNTFYLYYETAGKSVPEVHAYNSPIMLWPGRINRVRVLYHTATSLGAGNAIGVQAWVRPRRLTI